ncbi:uncharacterized protein LOC134267579 [Saccostrea cucullata]|uniref:uncharacterized protein LOC134267579 n=1 Tax=Saccostrea cuccullata TaxID=36930 RepID=UPI002ED55B92
MLLYKCSVLVLLAAPFVKLNHFRGGLLSWKAINETQITVHHRLSFVYNDSCPNRNSSATLICFPGGGCNDSTTMIGLCTESNSTENWADSEGDTNFTITNSTSTNVYFIGYTGDWISLVNASSISSLRIKVNVSTRTDTGRINQSPVSVMASSVKIRSSCGIANIEIPVVDFDGDYIRCRFPITTEECGDICNSTSTYFSFIGTSCALTTGLMPDGDYVVAVQIEDFTSILSSTALSSIPLQFIVTVNSSGSCYIDPYFKSNTYPEGSVIQFFNGIQQQIKPTVIVYDRPEIITKFHILSPLNFTMSNISNPMADEYETTILLAETSENEIGLYNLCFSAESNYR